MMLFSCVHIIDIVVSGINVTFVLKIFKRNIVPLPRNKLRGFPPGEENA